MRRLTRFKRPMAASKACPKRVRGLLDAANVDAGPIARVRLPHALSIGFHGWWKAV
jgi:hypothetical protein